MEQEPSSLCWKAQASSLCQYGSLHFPIQWTQILPVPASVQLSFQAFVPAVSEGRSRQPFFTISLMLHSPLTSSSSFLATQILHQHTPAGKDATSPPTSARSPRHYSVKKYCFHWLAWHTACFGRQSLRSLCSTCWKGAYLSFAQVEQKLKALFDHEQVTELIRSC